MERHIWRWTYWDKKRTRLRCATLLSKHVVYWPRLPHSQSLHQWRCSPVCYLQHNRVGIKPVDLQRVKHFQAMSHNVPWEMAWHFYTDRICWMYVRKYPWKFCYWITNLTSTQHYVWLLKLDLICCLDRHGKLELGSTWSHGNLTLCRRFHIIMHAYNNIMNRWSGVMSSFP